MVAKKSLNAQGLESVDGRVVDTYETRFSGGVQHSPDDMSGVSDGDLVTFIVVGRAKSPRFADAKAPFNFKRVNTFALDTVIPLSPERAQTLLNSMGRKVLGVNEGMIEAAETAPEQKDTNLRIVLTMPDKVVGDIPTRQSNVEAFNPITG